MSILQLHPIPTGYLFTSECEKGPLETLSIGDYGKAHNVRAEFLGHTAKIDGVPNQECMPLQEKWVITLSTQYGCPMACTFCDVPNIKFQGNASMADLRIQMDNAITLFPNVKYTERLNIHFARMGEPIMNDQVFHYSEWLAENKLEFQEEMGLRVEVIHPVLTTMLPRSLSAIQDRILWWCQIKNSKRYFNGQAGLQFSINSTDEIQRSQMFRDKQMTLVEFAKIAARMPKPVGRKYCLNFAYSTSFEVDAGVIAALFDPEKFMIKITPIHNNNSCRKNKIETEGGYDSYLPYEQVEQDFISLGFDTLVFVPSMDEEEGLVTCGNLILGGSKLKSKNDAVLRIKGQENERIFDTIGTA